MVNSVTSTLNSDYQAFVNPNAYSSSTYGDANFDSSTATPIVFQEETFSTAPTPLYPKIIPQQIHEKTKELIGQTTCLAASILYNNSPLPPAYAPHATRKVKPVEKQGNVYVPYIDLSTRSFSLFNSHRTEQHHHHHYSTQENGQEKKQNNDTVIRVIVGVFALAGAFFTAYKIGQAAGEGEEVQETFSNFKELKSHWIKHKDCYNDYSTYQTVVDRIVKKADGILQRRETNRVHKMALLILGLAACGTAFTGSVVGSGALMAAGLGMGAVVGGIALYKLGYACFSTRDQRDAKAIDTDFMELNQMLQPIVS